MLLGFRCDSPTKRPTTGTRDKGPFRNKSGQHIRFRVSGSRLGSQNCRGSSDGNALTETNDLRGKCK